MNPINFVEAQILIRTDPHIYAFSTNTIPSYLKVGDTSRPVDVRIEEWNKKISEALGTSVQVKLTKELAEAAVVDDAYFRDHAVHGYLKNTLGKKSIDQLDPDLAAKYSVEFFKDVTVADVKAAIADIRDEYRNGDPVKKYKYYKLSERKPVDFYWGNTQKWKLRPDQEEVVQRFVEKRAEKELLMYAVMRFGKSFTAMSCALRINAEKVLIVSAKADVATEWKATVEKPECFKDYKFLADRNFIEDPDAIDKALSENKKAAVFLTLQNLTGKDKDGEDIKKKLTRVFETEYDLIIVDETHFGAWAKNYGAALKEDEDSESIKADQNLKEDFEKEHSKLISKQKLHLSGTPYNLLYDRTFNSDNIIAMVQFSDIMDKKEKWDKEHFDDIENDRINPDTDKPYKEYDNPYFGFPKMLRFAFNPPQKTRDMLSALSEDGKWTLTEMFRARDDEFVHENDVLQLLKIIDGSENDDAILSFLDIPKIKEHDVCKHIIMVLPYKSSCDAMAKLLQDKHGDFKNLSNYKVLNVAGHKAPAELSAVDQAKNKISSCEEAGEKTITLTVNKMLTGVTVREWDTMIMLKNTHSAQEYDQAVFRIQNPYVVESESTDGDIIKKDMKPQTILVDFDPMRLFEIQGNSSNIVSAVSDKNQAFEEILQSELKYFPIITYNGRELVNVEPSNIVEIITRYNKQKSILDEAKTIELDAGILSDEYISSFINAQSKLGLPNKLTVDAHMGEETDLELPDSEEYDEDDTDTEDNNGDNNASPSSDSNAEKDKKANKELAQKFRMCMVNILFYVFLSNSRIERLEDVLPSLEEASEKQRNLRIFRHLGLDRNFIQRLCAQIRQQSSGKQFYIDINKTIINANLLSNDSSLTPEMRAANALDRFSRISDSEVVTSAAVCRSMIENIGIERLVKIVENGGKILDIAAKTGEFAYTVFYALKDRVDINKLKNCIYSIPTSGATYEFTRRMYEILGLELSNLADIDKISAYDLIRKNKKGKIDHEHMSRLVRQNKPFNSITKGDNIGEGDDSLNFDVVVGNPPYQQNISKSEGNKSLSKQLFPGFITLAANISQKYVSLITPSRWFTADAQDGSFIKLRQFAADNNHFVHIHNFGDSGNIFSGVAIGAVNYFLYDKSYEGDCEFYNEPDKTPSKRPLFEDNVDVILALTPTVSIVKKVISHPSFASLMSLATGRDAFGITGKQEKNVAKTEYFEGAYELRCAYEKIKYVKEETIGKNKDIANSWKIFVSKANGAAGLLSDGIPVSIIGEAYVGSDRSVCTDSLIPIGKFDNETEAVNLRKYMSTKFLRFMVGIMKVSQNIYQNVYKYVPMQDLTNSSDICWSKSVGEIDRQLYKKYGLTAEEINYIEYIIKPME